MEIPDVSNETEHRNSGASISTPNSSRSSRRRHSSGLSPASIFPPGNSHRPSKRSPFFRLAIRTLPPRSMTAAVTLIASPPDPSAFVRSFTSSILSGCPRLDKLCWSVLSKIADLGKSGYRWACYLDEGMGSALLPLRSKNARNSYPSRLLRPKTPGRLN